MKAVQFFNDAYLAQCAEMTPTEIAQFLDDFRQLHGATNQREQELQLKTFVRTFLSSDDERKYE